jgi:hypothetical protein
MVTTAKALTGAGTRITKPDLGPLRRSLIIRPTSAAIGASGDGKPAVIRRVQVGEVTAAGGWPGLSVVEEQMYETHEILMRTQEGKWEFALEEDGKKNGWKPVPVEDARASPYNVLWALNEALAREDFGWAANAKVLADGPSGSK